MLERRLHVYSFVRPLCRINQWLPGHEPHTVALTGRDHEGLLVRTQAHLSFTAQEEMRGQSAMRQMGITEGAPFVCILGRDSAYLDAVYPDTDWRYHDVRNCSIHNCVPAAQELVKRGYFSVRMGSIVKEALKTNHPMIIDYATTCRTEFLDIYLGARCSFYLTCGTGIDTIARTFRRPMAYTNLLPLEFAPTWGPRDIFIPKRLWLGRKGRFMSFPEILGAVEGPVHRTEQYEEYGIEAIENTAEEITALALEMDERLNGTWQSTEDDEELQERFWSLFKSKDPNRVLLSRIGADFLRENRALLD